MPLALFDWLTTLVSGQGWNYGLVAGIAMLDAFFPIVPSETVVITAGVVAAKGHLVVWLILLAAAVGAFAGDNFTYFLGDKLGDPAARRLFRGEKGRGRIEWAKRQIERHGVLIVIVARLIPGGRTATTFTAGMLGMPWRRRFVPADAVAVALWATYASMLGYVGGSTFQHSTWKALALAFGLALVVALLIELGRRVTRRRRPEAQAE